MQMRSLMTSYNQEVYKERYLGQFAVETIETW